MSVIAGSFCPTDKQAQEQKGDCCGYEISVEAQAFGCELQAFGGDEDVTDTDHRHKESRNKGYQTAV